MVFISIIVITKNNINTIDKCIHSILEQNYPSDNMEYIFVDGHSTDGTDDIIKEYQNQHENIKLFYEDSGSMGFARNVGIDNSSGEIILFTDSDGYPEKEWVKKIVYTFGQDPEIIVVGGMDVLQGSAEITSTMDSWRRLEKSYDVEAITKIKTVNFAIKREILFDYGKFNPNLSHFDEGELMSRLFYKIEGSRIVYDPDIIVHHDRAISDLQAGLKKIYKKSIIGVPVLLFSPLRKVALNNITSPVGTSLCFVLANLILPFILLYVGFFPENLLSIILGVGGITVLVIMTYFFFVYIRTRQLRFSLPIILLLHIIVRFFGTLVGLLTVPFRNYNVTEQNESDDKGKYYVAFILFWLQLLLFINIYISRRSPAITLLSSLSYIFPILHIYLNKKNRKVILCSLILLFITQHSIFLFSRSTVQYTSGSDAVNDFHIAQVISETGSLVLGKTGYSSRPSYSYYPLIHLFSVVYSAISAIPLEIVSFYIQPCLNAILIPLLLYAINKNLFFLDDEYNYVSIMVFSLNFYYTFFQSNYIRESFSFPFSLIAFAITAKILNDTTDIRKNHALFILLSSGVILSHHISSYILLFIVSVVILSYNLIYENKNMNLIVILFLILQSLYSFYIVTDYALTQIAYTLIALRSIFFLSGGSSSVLSSTNVWDSMLTQLYYIIIGIFSVLGLVYLYSYKKDRKELLPISIFFIIIFGLSMVLRLTTAPHPWSWAYYMSLRSTIWSFIGLSVVVSYGLKYLFVNMTARRFILGLTLIVLLLSGGKNSQYISYVIDPTFQMPMDDYRYQSSMWLKEHATHGANMLVPSYHEGFDVFEGSRNMAPYSYLKEYFLDQYDYDEFTGYIPIINEYFESYKTNYTLDIIFSNGFVEIGYE